MSLQNIPGVGGLGLGSQSFIPQSIPSDCQSSCCTPSVRLSLSQLAQRGNIKGELTGDDCFTIDINEEKISAAIFNENDLTSMSLRSAMSAAIGITSQGYQALEDEADLSQLIPGILFGDDAEAKKGDNVDIIFPSRLNSILNSEFPVFSLSKSSGGDATITSQEALALLVRYWAEKAKSKRGESSSKSKKSKKQGLVSFVVPGYFGMKQRKELIIAAKIAGLEIRNIFNRGVAAVAAGLSHPSDANLYSSLQKWITSTCCSDQIVAPVVLFVHSSSHGIDVALISCEKPKSKNSDERTNNNVMGFDRLVTLSAGGGPFEGYGLGGSPTGPTQLEKEKLICQLISNQLSIAGINEVCFCPYVILQFGRSPR
jgi:hypothetical protein